MTTNALGWCEGNAIKYVCRHRTKNGAEDVRKAIHYLQLLLEWEYSDEHGPGSKSENRLPGG